MDWLGNHIRFELQREEWEQQLQDSELCIDLYSPTWQLRGNKYVAFSFNWPNLFESPFDSPGVMLHLQLRVCFRRAMSY